MLHDVLPTGLRPILKMIQRMIIIDKQ